MKSNSVLPGKTLTNCSPLVGAFLMFGVSIGCGAADAPVPEHEYVVLSLKLPDDMAVGRGRGLDISPDGHIWMAHSTEAIESQQEGRILLGLDGPNPDGFECCSAAPPILEFDAEGNFVQGWGGPSDEYDWPRGIHGLHFDHTGHIWIAGEDPRDAMILKFTRDGEFVMQIGQAQREEVLEMREQLGWSYPAETTSGDTTNVGRAADMRVHGPTNELFVADGYGNHRVAVFDAATGEYKRHWGAYGDPDPDDSIPQPDSGQFGVGESANQFHVPHDIAVSDDGMVYVADRGHNRIQVFTGEGEYLEEVFISRSSRAGASSVGTLDFSADPEQGYLYVGDAGNGRVRVLDRQTFEEVGQYGRLGYAPGQFMYIHQLRVGPDGAFYVMDIRTGTVSKFAKTN